jgi:hypothetical protein
MEKWVLLGESGSDADTVQFADGSDDSASDKGSETSFTTVQIGGDHLAADALDSSVNDLASCGDGEYLPGSPIGGDNVEESDGAYGYFDLNLPALAGSKAVFGAAGDCFDLNLAASILSMDSDAEDDDDDEQLESRTRGRHLEDIDMESIGSTNGDGIEHPERRACAHCANIDTDQSSDGIDTESSDPAENDYASDAEADTDDEQPAESYSCGRHLDDIDTESVCAVGDDHIDTDVAGSDYSDDDTESSDPSGTGGDDARNSAGASMAASLPPTAPHLFFPNRAGASTAASPPPCAPHLYFLNRAGASTAPSRTLGPIVRPTSSSSTEPRSPRQRRGPPVRPTSTSAIARTN